MVQDYLNFLKFGIKNVQKSLLNRELTVTKLCQESLQNIYNSKNLNSFITINYNEALQKADQLDCDRAQRKEEHLPANLLHGIPVSIKDNFCMQNVLTTCGSKMLHNFVPPYTATAVQKLEQANCLIMGKTNMDEFAMGSSSTTSHFGPTANSWLNSMAYEDRPSILNSKHWYMAGGSSTGSAISISSGSCFASLATDTGGSARQPASLTGIVGYKPTYGLISRFGLIPLAHCLDVVSILTRNVSDARIVFDTIVGIDENDLTTVDHKSVLVEGDFDLNGKSRKLRVGIPEEFIKKSDMSGEVSEQFDKILQIILNQSENFEVIKLSLPNSSLATECYTVVSSAEIASNMSCYDGVKYGYSKRLDASTSEASRSPIQFDREQFYRDNRNEGLGSEVKKRILLGNYFLLEQNRERYFVQALKLRRLISDEFEQAFADQKVDFIMMPSTPSIACTYEDWLKKQDDNRLFHEDYFLIPSNLANLPSISLPAGLSSTEKLPIGLQLIANRFHDLNLLKISEMFERNILANLVS